MHTRLSRRRGPASSHACVGCGEAAREWAYQHGCPNEVTEVYRGSTYKFCAHLDCYKPMCKKCHYQFDGSSFGGHGGHVAPPILSDDDVREIRRRFAAGESGVYLARSFGVGSGYISSIVCRRARANVPDSV